MALGLPGRGSGPGEALGQGVVALFLARWAAQLALDRIAGTDLSAHLRYQEAVREHHEVLKAHFHPMIFEAAPLSAVDWGEVPVFSPPRVETAGIPSVYGPLLLLVGWLLVTLGAVMNCAPEGVPGVASRAWRQESSFAGWAGAVPPDSGTLRPGLLRRAVAPGAHGPCSAPYPGGRPPSGIPCAPAPPIPPGTGLPAAGGRAGRHRREPLAPTGAAQGCPCPPREEMNAMPATHEGTLSTRPASIGTIAREGFLAGVVGYLSVVLAVSALDLLSGRPSLRHGGGAGELALPPG